MTTRTTKRLLSELHDHQSAQNASAGLVSLHPSSDEDLLHWSAILTGPPGTVYDHCSLKLEIIVPSDYPAHPPVIRFERGRIFHPNVTLPTGEICLDVLKDQWSPVWTLASACLAIQALLASPEPSSPLNVDAANLLRQEDFAAYNALALLYLSR